MAITAESLQQRRFFPLHLKLMLSYLVLATVLLAVSSAFAWREARQNSMAASTAGMEESFKEVKQEFDRRLERSLAVVNLAAGSPQLTADIAAQGYMVLGPTSDGTASASGNYQALARYVTDTSAFPNGANLQPDRSYSGFTVIDGQPQAVALTPVTLGSERVGFLSVTVDASSVMDVLADSDNTAHWVVLEGTIWRSIGRETSPTLVSGNDFRSLAAGKSVEKITSVDEGSVRMVLYPIKGIDGLTAAALAIEGSSQTGGGADASPLLGLAVLTVSVGLFIAHYLARMVSRPVEKITEATERVAAGELAYQLPPRRSTDELGVLSASFNSMTQKYCTSQAEVEAAAIKLQQTVIEQDAEIQTLFGISRAIASILDIRNLLDHVLQLSMPLVGGNRGVVWSYAPLTGTAAAIGGEIDRGAGLFPVVTAGPAIASEPRPIPENHEILKDLDSREWRICVLLPKGEAGRQQKRQLFYASADEKAPYEEQNEIGMNIYNLPDGIEDRQVTRVIVPVPGHKETTTSLLEIVVPAKRPLTKHEAMLIYNIVSLASVAVDNAELYSLAKQRGEQIAVLLRESQHRIANNLAAISGVLNLQRNKTRNPELSRVIEDNLARINSIAQVHRLLTGELRDEVEISGMLREVASSTIGANGGGGISLEVTGPEIVVPAGKATSLAIVINELVINSIKHGFNNGKGSGNISVNLSLTDGLMLIDYRDTGSPSDGEATVGQGLGSQIMNSLIKDDLAGNWTSQSNSAGYEAAIHFPLPA